MRKPKKPTKPKKPKAPKKKIVGERRTDCPYVLLGSEVTVESFNTASKSLVCRPEEVTLVLNHTWGGCYECGGDDSNFYWRTDEESEDPKYLERLAVYEKKLVVHKEKMKVFEKKTKEYEQALETWEAQQTEAEIANLKKRLQELGAS